MRQKARWWMILLVVATASAACAEEPADAPVDETPTVEDDLVPPSSGGKSDTGYLSTLAVELEGVFTSHLTIDISAMDPAQRQAELDRLMADTWGLQSAVDRQLKYAKNQINTEELHLNLSSSNLRVLASTVDDTGHIQIDYSTTVETIVTQAELKETGGTMDQIVGKTLTAVLPNDPTQMAAKVGVACLQEGHDTAEDYNYFYYYDPAKAGCAEAMTGAGIERIDGTLEVHSLAPSKTVYPEYDRLVKDGKVDVVVFFGAAEHGWEPGKWDWGTYSRDNFVRDLKNRDFRLTESTDRGDHYRRTVGTLQENVTIVGPEVLKSLENDVNNLFSELVRTNEIIFYNGHSFYGSLSVLDRAEIYPGTYQIFFMNSCWSYEYYTKQIFKHNVTDTDPTGWENADVVNDTESGWFHNMAPESRILLTNLLRGAETGGREGDRFYTWDRIIGAMNDHAKREYESRSTKTHEIYGVSGVRTNMYDPDGF